MKKGQAAVVDALILMMICSAAATLLIYVSGLYGSNTNTQILTIYNYEYMGIAMLSMRYVEDDNGDLFWSQLKENLDLDLAGNTYNLEGEPHEMIEDYFNDNTFSTAKIMEKLDNSSPGKPVLHFHPTTAGFSNSAFACYYIDNPNSSNHGEVECVDVVVTKVGDVLNNREITKSDYFVEYSTATTLKDTKGNYWEVSLHVFH